MNKDIIIYAGGAAAIAGAAYMAMRRPPAPLAPVSDVLDMQRIADLTAKVARLENGGGEQLVLGALKKRRNKDLGEKFGIAAVASIAAPILTLAFPGVGGILVEVCKAVLP